MLEKTQYNFIKNLDGSFSLEMIIKNPNDFNLLKVSASFAHQSTGVICFDDLNDLPNNICDFVPQDAFPNKETSNYVDVDIKKHKFWLKASPACIEFCNGYEYKEGYGVTSYDNIKFIYILLKHGIVKPTERFRNFFSHVEENVRLCELNSFDETINFRKDATWSFRKYFEKNSEDKDVSEIRVVDSKIFEINDSKTPALFEVTCVIENVNKANKKALCKDVNNKTNKYEIKRYGWAPFKSRLWVSGNTIRFITNKKYNQQDGYSVVINPIIIPSNIEIGNINNFTKDLASVVNRKFPTVLFNKLYFEWKIRTEII